MQDLDFLQAIGLWWSGRKLENFTMYGWPMLYWARLGKCLQFIGSTAVVLDLLGEDRLREMSTITNRARKGLGIRARTWWIASTPIRWEDQKKSRHFFRSLSACTALSLSYYVHLHEIEVTSAWELALTGFYVVASMIYIIFLCLVFYPFMYAVRLLMWHLLTTLGLHGWINSEEQHKPEGFRAWWLRFTPFHVRMGWRGAVILVLSLSLMPLTARLTNLDVSAPEGPAWDSVTNPAIRTSMVIAAIFIISWSATLSLILSILAIAHGAQALLLGLSYIFGHDHPRHPIRWAAFAFVAVGFPIDLLGS